MNELEPWLKPAWEKLQQWHPLPHALLIIGPQGIGKLKLTERLALNLLCHKPNHQNACQTCHNCQLFLSHTHPDYLCISPQKNTIKIDQIREMRELLTQTAQQGGMRIIVIDQAHWLNQAAANALLKTLEEPQPETLILLLTDQPKLLLPTIRSRCQYLKIFVDETQIPSWAAEKEQCEHLGKDLLKLLQKKIDPVSIASQWQKQELEVILSCLQWGLLDILRYQLSWPLRLGETFAQLANLLNHPKILIIYDELIKLRGAVAAHINLNPQLALESLLIKISPEKWGGA